MKALFTNWSLTTPNDNVVEIYINQHTEGKSFRIVVKDDNLVETAFYKADAKVTRLVVADKTIYEGENFDVNFPHFYMDK